MPFPLRNLSWIMISTLDFRSKLHSNSGPERRPGKHPDTFSKGQPFDEGHFYKTTRKKSSFSMWQMWYEGYEVTRFTHGFLGCFLMGTMSIQGASTATVRSACSANPGGSIAPWRERSGPHIKGFKKVWIGHRSGWRMMFYYVLFISIGRSSVKMMLHLSEPKYSNDSNEKRGNKSRQSLVYDLWKSWSLLVDGAQSELAQIDDPIK